MSVSGIGQNYYQNNLSTNKRNRSKEGQFYLQKQAAEATASEEKRQNANVQDIYESEAKTEIITKPDGSRVLVMTMSIGGMETTMSLEISKPTEAPNGNSKQASPVPGRWENRGAEAALNDRGEIDGNGGLIK